MKIEIHIRETDTHGNRLGRRNAFVESCRVYKEAGDGIRLDNIAPTTYHYFNLVAKRFAKAYREARNQYEFIKAVDIDNMIADANKEGH